jgi:membrane-associated phospholipid phosphatase
MQKSNLKYFFISILVFSFSFQSITSAQIIDSLRSDVGSFFVTGGNLFSDYFHFKKSTELNTAGSVLFIAAGYSVDYNMKNLAGRNRSSFNDDIFSIDKVYGDTYTLIGIGGLYGTGLLLNNSGVRRLGLQTIEAVGWAGLITSVIKAVAGRSRPYTGEGKTRFRPFNVHAAYTSFPSGHATVSFAVSTVLANNTNNIFLKVLCYTAAFTVAGARIYHNDHWFSDVIAGSLIGHFVGDYVSSKETQTINKNQFSFYLTSNSLGFTVAF